MEKMTGIQKTDDLSAAGKMDALDRELEAYAAGVDYPFHMPGHKRVPLAMPNPYTIDITEIDGFDHLHDAKGILKEAQKRAAALYGAQQSFYLVNGSTCGILTAVFAAVPRNGTLLMARNSHKAAYHAAYLRNLKTVYLNPRMTEFGILGAVSPEEVEEALAQHAQVDAVLITSPTYEGVVSDISAIARIAHRYGIPLIVDEAHGAHLGFHEAFPQTAVRQGADLVIQSMHKVLPSLTQTALLHLNTGYIAPQAIEKYRGMFETSSPSYVLMAGMEKCIRLLAEEKKQRFQKYTEYLEEFYRKAESLSRLHIMQKSDFAPGEIYNLDPSKIVISVQGTTMDACGLYHTLRKRYRLQMEMVSGFYVLGMTSIMDSREGFLRLYQALCEIDEEIGVRRQNPEERQFIRRLYAPKERRLELYEAMDLPVHEAALEQAAGEVSGCVVNLYPPGIPVLLPGEVIDVNFIKNIRKCRDFQLNLQGIADIRNERINIVKF